MSRLDEATAWVYRGIWGVLAKWFHVPAEPPSLPVTANEHLQSLRPARGFLRYLKFRFWLALWFVDVALLVAWLSVTIARPRIGVWLAPFVFALMVLPDIVAYIAIHLRYDTTWYVLSQRSLRIRRGIWVIHETTITFENIQNVSVESGPIERWFGIANVIVDTAGGGSGKDEKRQATNFHRGIVEGIDNAAEIRDLILNRLRHSRTSGLGDDLSTGHTWAAPHTAVLREIRDVLQHGEMPKTG